MDGGSVLKRSPSLRGIVPKEDALGPRVPSMCARHVAEAQSHGAGMVS